MPFWLIGVRAGLVLVASFFCNCEGCIKCKTGACTSIHYAGNDICERKLRVHAAATRSVESLEPAPTEEGYYLGGQIEKVLSELQEEGQSLQTRRYSRSFSEPNLFLRAMEVLLAALTVIDTL